MTSSENSLIILDDGTFFVELSSGYAAKHEPGLLLRRCHHGITTPSGFECVGGFSVDAVSGNWNSDIQTGCEDQEAGGCKVVVANSSRMEAICGLWRSRDQAFFRAGV